MVDAARSTRIHQYRVHLATFDAASILLSHGPGHGLFTRTRSSTSASSRLLPKVLSPVAAWSLRGSAYSARQAVEGDSTLLSRLPSVGLARLRASTPSSSIASTCPCPFTALSETVFAVPSPPTASRACVTTFRSSAASRRSVAAEVWRGARSAGNSAHPQPVKLPRRWERVSTDSRFGDG